MQDASEKRGASEKQVSEHVPSKSDGLDAIRYESRRLKIRYEDIFDGACPLFLWKSCEDPLVWTTRAAIDGCAPREEKPRRRFVLLDAYDRLTAMEHRRHVRGDLFGSV